jgi:hypothetical protein
MVSRKSDRRRLFRFDVVPVRRWLLSTECQRQIHLCTAKYLTLKRGESNIPNLFVKLEIGMPDEPPANHRGARARPSVTTATGRRH